MISGQGIHCRGRNRFNGSAHAAGKLLREVPHQERNVPLAFSQGRHLDRKNIQAKEEIGSELLLAYHLFQISVPPGHQTPLRFNPPPTSPPSPPPSLPSPH